MDQRIDTRSDRQPASIETADLKIATIFQLADTSIQACDTAVTDLIGYTPEQIIGTTAFDPPWQIIHADGTQFQPEDYPAIVSLRTGKPCQNVTMGFYQPSGELVWLRVDATPLFQAHTLEPYAVVVTLRKEFNVFPECQQVQSQLERFQFLVEHASEQIALLTKDCRFQYVNDAFCQRHGYSRNELRSLSAYDIKVNGSLQEFEQLWHAAQQQSIQLDVQHRAKSGEIFDIDVTLEYFRFNGEEFLCGFGREITERKRAELMLVEQKRLLELIASGHPLDDCLSALCDSVSRLNPSTRACFLLTDAQKLTFPRSITPDLPPSFGQGLKDAPINDLCIGTCGEAVYRGQPITCADIARDDRWSQEWRDLCVAHGVLACHSVPVLGIDNLPLGSLMLCFNEARMPTTWEYQLAEFGTQVASIVFERDRSICALRESEERLSLAIEGADLVTWDADLKTGKTIWSSNSCRILGYEPRGEATIEMWQCVHPDDLASVIQAWEIAQQQESLYSVEYRIIRADNGQVVWLAASGRFLYNQAQQAVRFVGVMFDISDRKCAEAELRHSNQTLRTLIAASPLPIVVIEPDSTVRLWNPAATQVFGWSEAEVLHQPLLIVPEEKRHECRQILQAIMNGETFIGVETYRRKQDGSDVIVSISATLFGEDNKILLIFQDITDRKLTEAELRQKNAILSVINESAPTPIFVKDRQGRIIYANPATLEVLGKSASEVIGYYDRDLYESPADAERVMKNDQRIMESGQTQVVEESPDGIRTFLGMKAPYRNEAGEVIGLISTLR